MYDLLVNLSGKSIAIMQPYLLPHISYFQLISACNLFYLHDKVKYTKQSWINRNRINAKIPQKYFTLPLKNGSDYDLINQKIISSTYDPKKILRVLKNEYNSAPNFGETYPILESIFNFESRNLFSFIYNSISVICLELEISTPFVVNSEIDIPDNLYGEDLVIFICKALSGETYINSIGGRKLYSSENFTANGIELRFLESSSYTYINSLGRTDSKLSIIDSLMWADRRDLIGHIKSGMTFFSDPL
jgi:hypothetical protein